MAKRLTVSHPDIDGNIKTYISKDYASGTTLTVKNTSGYAANDYILAGRFGVEQTEVLQIASITNKTTLVLIASGSFSHATDTTITKIDYNQFKVYRSTTGAGGIYAVLSTENLLVDEAENSYYDSTAINPYSYKFSYYNSTTTQESVFSDEIPFGGYPPYALKSMQDTILEMFDDQDQQFINRNLITTWLNECYSQVQFAITDSDSPYFVASTTITSTGDISYDLSSYGMLAIYFIEVSNDSGVTYKETITPTDFRMENNGGIASSHAYTLAGTTISIAPNLTTGKVMRIWYLINPVILVNPTDELIDPFKRMTYIFIDYCMMRAHEKDRKMNELAIYYKTKFNTYFVMNPQTGPVSVLMKYKSRLKQGNFSMSTSWADSTGY